MKRRLSVAIALMGHPSVAFLDEPTRSLDPSSRRLVWNLIRKEKEKTTIVITTRSMEEAETLCDRIGIFVDGRFQAIGDPKARFLRF